MSLNDILIGIVVVLIVAIILVYIFYYRKKSFSIKLPSFLSHSETPKETPEESVEPVPEVTAEAE